MYCYSNSFKEFESKIYLNEVKQVISVSLRFGDTSLWTKFSWMAEKSNICEFIFAVARKNIVYVDFSAYIAD